MTNFDTIISITINKTRLGLLRFKTHHTNEKSQLLFLFSFLNLKIFTRKMKNRFSFAWFLTPKEIHYVVVS